MQYEQVRIYLASAEKEIAICFIHLLPSYFEERIKINIEWSEFWIKFISNC